MVEKKRNLIALLVTNCQRALPAKFQFIVQFTNKNTAAVMVTAAVLMLSIFYPADIRTKGV